MIARMTNPLGALTDSITALLPPLLHALEGLAFIARYLHPPQLRQVIAHVGNADGEVRKELVAFQATAWPDDPGSFKERLERAAISTIRGYEELRAATENDDGVMAAYKALRHAPRALEALYPLTAPLPPVSRFFLETAQRNDKDILAGLAAEPRAGMATGVHHFGNSKTERGGFSLYVPENYDPTRSYPLIVALHGGSGHGRDFLWSWLKTARSRGALLISPTSVGSTWSLTDPDEDGSNFKRMIAHVSDTWRIDSARILLTGMSDGGTFTYVQGLAYPSPFSHLAPVSASFHPFLLEMMDRERLEGLPVYLVHGAKDWMFPVDIARTAHQALKGGGANIVYREIADLSHAYPREENVRILDWFLDGQSSVGATG